MLIESKSVLARLMATENLIVEQRKVPTASFDVKNRILTIPILNGNLSPEVYDLMIGHETGHALETPLEGWHDSIVDLKVNRSILNICEDARIEKKIKRKFPGIRVSFVKGYRQLFDMDFFGVKGKDLNKLNFIDRVNLYTKGGSAQGIEFSLKEAELLREVENAETFDETVQVAIKIQKFMKEQRKQEKEQMQQKSKKFSMPSDGQDYDESDEIDESDDFDSDELESKDQFDSEGYDDEYSLDEFEDDSGTTGTNDTNIRSVTDDTFRKKEQELYSEENKEIVYSDIPELYIDNLKVSYENIIEMIIAENIKNTSYNKEVFLSEYNKFKNESNKVVSYLVKEFEMRKNAEQQSRSRISKTGELNLNKIHEYRFTDDIFARMTKVPNGKSHGLVMFIDWSGSMAEHMSATIKQLLNLVFFCKKVNIPFEVYAFASGLQENANEKPIQANKVGTIRLEHFSLLNLLSSKMTIRQFTFMASHLLKFVANQYNSTCWFPKLMHLSGTPLNEAIIAAYTILPEFKKANKIDIVNAVFLTDGNGAPLHHRFASESTFSHSINVSRYRRCWFRDPVTKASVEIDSKNNKYLASDTFAAMQTIALLKLLKQRANCNIIGFYICSMRYAREAISTYIQTDDTLVKDKHIADFKKKNYTLLSDVGYDDYYFLRSDKLDIEDSEFTFEPKNTNVTTRSLVSAFSKYTSGRLLNRVILNRFITLIA